MAFNGFPIGYQPAQMYYPSPQNTQAQQMQQVQQPQSNNGIIWVQGEAGAKSYLVAPNTTVQLWDSESQVIYLKSADASGMPTMKIIDYTIRDAGQQNVDIPVAHHDEYATKEEIAMLRNELNDIKAKMKAVIEKEVSDNEQSAV